MTLVWCKRGRDWTCLFVLSDDVGKERCVDLDVVSALLQTDAVHLSRFSFRRSVRGVHLPMRSVTSEDAEMDRQGHLEDAVLPSLFLLQHVERFRCVTWGDHTVGDLSRDDLCSREVAWRRQSNKVAKGRHSIGTYVMSVRSTTIYFLSF